MKNKYSTSTRKKNGNVINYTVTIKENPILYQYRTVNPYSVKALLNSEIWATVPTAFNDPYDSTFCFSESKIKREIKKHITKENLPNYVALVGSPNGQTICRISDLVDYIYEQHFRSQANQFRETICVSCFSEVYDSEIMWAHYAGNATGFSVEYDSLDLQKIAQEHRSFFSNQVKKMDLLGIDLNDCYEEGEDSIRSLLPVVYANHKYSCDEQLLNYTQLLFQYLDMILKGDTIQNAYRWLMKESLNNHYKFTSRDSMIYSTLGFKQTVWSYEKEWRIWSYNINPLIGNFSEKHVLLGKAKPLSICLGEFISRYDEIALLEIAKNTLKVPVYKMKSKMGRNTMRLVPYQIL